MGKLVIRFILAMLEKMGVSRWISYNLLRPIIVESEGLLINVEKNIAAQINRWVSRGAVADGIYELGSVIIKKYLERVLGREIKNIDRESVLNALGEYASEIAEKELKEKYHVDVPLQPMYPVAPFIANLGYLMAAVANKKLGSHIFTTFIPPDNLKGDIDSWLLNELYIDTGIELQTIFDRDLIKKIKELALGRIIDTLNSHLASISQNAVQLALGDSNNVTAMKFYIRTSVEPFYTEVSMNDVNQLQAFKAAVLSYFIPQLQDFCQNQINHLVADGMQKYGVVPAVYEKFSNGKLVTNFAHYEPKTNKWSSPNGIASRNILRQKNRARQARYRLTHKENRVWLKK